MDEIAGISADMSIASKTISRLNEYIHQRDLFVYFIVQNATY